MREWRTIQSVFEKCIMYLTEIIFELCVNGTFLFCYALYITFPSASSSLCFSGLKLSKLTNFVISLTMWLVAPLSTSMELSGLIWSPSTALITKEWFSESWLLKEYCLSSSWNCTWLAASLLFLIFLRQSLSKWVLERHVLHHFLSGWKFDFLCWQSSHLWPGWSQEKQINLLPPPFPCPFCFRIPGLLCWRLLFWL